MSLRLEMLQVARLACKVLGDSAELTRRFLYGQINEDGGFKDREGKSDLYYTVFGLEGLAALAVQSPPVLRSSSSSAVTPLRSDIIPADSLRAVNTAEGGKSKVQSLEDVVHRTEKYLGSFAHGEGLDFVHLCGLARCWAGLMTLDSQTRQPTVARPQIL